MNRMLRISLMVLALLLTVVKEGCAQLYNAEIEVYIPLHKRTGPSFTARNGVEVLNESFHDNTRESTKKYREVSDTLGLYYKAFNWVDIGFNSLKMAFNVYNTGEIAKKRISGIADLLRQYEQQCLLRGDIEAGDQEILDIGQDLYRDIMRDVDDIRNSAIGLLGYNIAQVPATTFSVLNSLKDMNVSLENIQKTLNGAYGRLYRFMLMRLGWRWDFAYVQIDRTGVAESAIGRWKDATRESMNRMSFTGE